MYYVYSDSSGEQMIRHLAVDLLLSKSQVAVYVQGVVGAEHFHWELVRQYRSRRNEGDL